MKRRIIKIDQEKCNGCGACAAACHESAITMVNGKVTLLREDYCDGLGDCLPACPTGAIAFEEREAAAYDHAAVQQNLARLGKVSQPAAGGCPGSRVQQFQPAGVGCPGSRAQALNHTVPEQAPVQEMSCSQLRQWPVQIKLAPVQAPFFQGAHLLIAADCAAYACGDFHARFMRGKVTLIGCPKLDAVQYADKLTEIIRENDIKSVTVVRMQVPCCGGMERAVKTALQNSGKFLPWQVVVLATDGRVLQD